MEGNTKINPREPVYGNKDWIYQAFVKNYCWVMHDFRFPPLRK